MLETVYVGDNFEKLVTYSRGSLPIFINYMQKSQPYLGHDSVTKILTLIVSVWHYHKVTNVVINIPVVISYLTKNGQKWTIDETQL